MPGAAIEGRHVFWGPPGVQLQYSKSFQSAKKISCAEGLRRSGDYNPSPASCASAFGPGNVILKVRVGDWLPEGVERMGRPSCRFLVGPEGKESLSSVRF